MPEANGHALNLLDMCLRLQLIKQTIKTIIKHFANKFNKLYLVTNYEIISIKCEKDYVILKFKTIEKDRKLAIALCGQD